MINRDPVCDLHPERPAAMRLTNRDGEITHLCFECWTARGGFAGNSTKETTDD
jgi:hypothetical protein